MFTSLRMTAVLAFASIAIYTPVRAQETATEAKNKQVVLEFYEKGLNQKDADAAISYFGSRYTQHNPVAADGVDGFRRFVAFLRKISAVAH